MCNLAEFPKEYEKLGIQFRLLGIHSDDPGLYILRKAIIMYYSKYCLEEDDASEKEACKRVLNDKFYEELKKGMIIPANRDIAEKLKEIDRDSTMQYMIETLKVSNLINESKKRRKKKSVEVDVARFIINLAKQLKTM